MLELLHFHKISRRDSKGFLADYCPVCGEITEHEFFDIYEATHWLLLRIEAGKLVDHERKCLVCVNAYKTNRSEYRRLLKNRGRSLEELIRETHPNIEKTMEVQRKMASKVASGQASPEDRLAIVRDVLARIEPLLIDHAKQKQFSCLTGIIFMVMFVGVLVLYIACKSAIPPDRAFYGWATFGWGLTFGCLAAYWAVTDQERYLSRMVYPRILTDLAPLKPTPQELEMALEGLRSKGMATGKILKVDHITKLLRERGM